MAKRTKYGNTPWGKEWIQALEIGGMRGYSPDPRLARGKTYANTGRVRDIELLGSTVKGKVQGSDPRPYKVVVELHPFTPAQKEKLLSFVSSNPALLTDFTRGVIPSWFLAWAKENHLPLSPASWGEMSGDCSCPDWGNPCKHQVAVFYALTNDIDRNPLLLFHLRGITSKELLEAGGKNDIPDIVPPLAEPVFIPFAEATTLSQKENPADNWYKDWLPQLEMKFAEKIVGILPAKPRFSFAQMDFRDVVEQIYRTLPKYVKPKRTSGKKPAVMPDVWLQYIPEDHLWQPFLTVPEGDKSVYMLANEYGVKSVKLPQWSEEKGIQLSKTWVTTCTMRELIAAYSDVAGFSVKLFHTPSSRFFCAALDLAYKLIETNSYKPVLVSVTGRKNVTQAKTGVILKVADKLKSLAGAGPNAQHIIRYEPFVPTAAESDALNAALATLRALLPPEMVVNDPVNAVLAPHSFDVLFSEILTDVVHLLARPLLRNYYFNSNELALSLITPTPLQSKGALAKIMANDMHDWLSWLDIAGMDIMPVLRLDEPSDETMTNNPNAPFTMHCEIHDRVNALTQPIPIRQVLSAKGKILGQDADKVRTLVLRSLDAAAQHSTELAWMLDSRNAERGAPVEIPLAELYKFLTETASRLRELGVGLVLPQALVRLVRPRPRAKAKSKGGVQYLSMQDLFNFEYIVALCEHQVSVLEFLRLLTVA